MPGQSGLWLDRQALARYSTTARRNLEEAMPENPLNNLDSGPVWMGSDDALGDHDAVGIADAIASGAISASEAVEAAIERRRSPDI